MKTSIVLGPKMASIDNFQSELRELPRLNVKSLLLRVTTTRPSVHDPHIS
jgi:hypothetical protein